MNRSNMAKVVATFVAGVVLTMGALIYSRTHELTQLRKAVQTAPSSAVSAHDELSVAPVNGPEDLKASGRPIQADEGESNKRVPAEVPEPAVPARADQLDTLSDSGSEVAQNPPPSSVPKTIPAIIAPGLAGNNQSNAAAAEGQQPSNAETTPEPPKPKLITLPPGTSLAIRFEGSVSTERNRSGDTFRARLDSPLIVNGFVLADKGARVFGQIEKIKRARLLRGRSGLRLRLTEITMRDGQRVRIETSPWEEKSARSSIVGRPKLAAGAAMGAVVGALTGAAKSAGFVSNESGARKGTPNGANKRTVVVTTGARLTFLIARPVTITEKVNNAETRR